MSKQHADSFRAAQAKLQARKFIAWSRMHRRRGRHAWAVRYQVIAAGWRRRAAAA